MPGRRAVASKYPSLKRTPQKDSWIENVGGLPKYIDEIARSIKAKRGATTSRAIQLAIGAVRRWARGGDNVNADTRAKAAKAVAEWEAKKARSKAKTAAKKAKNLSAEDFADRLTGLGMDKRKARVVGREVATRLTKNRKAKG